VKGPKASQAGLKTEINQKQWRFNSSFNLYENIHDSEVLEGFNLIIHDPFEVSSDDSIHVQTLMHQTVDLFVTPQVTEIENSLIEFEPEELNYLFTYNV
jgi:hypothetical protein